MRRLLSIGALLLCAYPSWGQDVQLTQGPVQIHSEKTRFRVSGGTDFSLFSDSGQSIWGIVASGDMQYAFTRRWGISAGIRQAFSSSGFSSFFTQIHLAAAMALTGSLMTTQEQVSVGGAPVAQISGLQPSGWVGRFYLSEYFISTTGAVLPYTGLGVGVSYDWNWEKHFPFSVGIRIDRITNGAKSYFPVAAYATIGLWI